MLLLCLLAFNDLVLAVQYTDEGCYSASDIENAGLTSKGTYVYQSVSYCQEQCGSAAVVALYNGNACYCGDSVSFLSSLEQTSGSCNVDCVGWPYQTCGGSSSMEVYVNDAYASSLSSQSVSSSTSSSTSSSSSTTSSTTSTSSSLSSSTSYVSSSGSSAIASSSGSSATSSSTGGSTTSSSTSPSSSLSSTLSSSTATSSSSSDSSSDITSIRYTTRLVTASVSTGSDQQAQTVFVTTTSVVNPSSSDASSTSGGASTSTDSSTDGKSTSNKKSGISGGAIAGIVVGVVCGVLIVAAVVLIILWRRHKSNEEPDLEQTKQYQPYSFGDADANPIILPSSSATSNWRRPSRNDLGSNDANSSTHGVPTGTISANNSLNRGAGGSNTAFTSDDTNAVHLQNHPSTVFEEPPSIYEGNQRFSTGSLPDMMEDRQLRVVNPDDSMSRLDEHNYEDQDEDNFTSTGSSRGSGMDHEPKL